MREKIHHQQPIVPAAIAHEHAIELQKISEVLDQLSEAVDLVHSDLVRPGTNPNKGRKGITAEQVLRAMIIKQMNGFSYDELAFHLADSSCYRRFCRFGIADNLPTRSTLQKNIKRVRPETWEAINKLVVRHAAEANIERGKKVRVDCTVVESNIHHPMDSTLLWDSVRVLARLMSEAREEFDLAFNDHSRRAKRRALAILNAGYMRKRVPLYRDLLNVTRKTVSQAERIAEELDKVVPNGMMQAAKLETLTHELHHFVKLANQVVSQTERRVLGGESVPASEKIVSIFEPHTDIIVKDRRGTLYGHKICLTSGTSGMVTDVVVERGNPADVTLAVKMIQRQRELFGKAPRQATFDGGFASRANVTDIKALGTDDVAFSKPCGLQITDMVKSSWVFRRLKNFRAGVEGVISFLKRVFGLARCTWSGFASFRAYVVGSVLACNLLIVARHSIARAT